MDFFMMCTRALIGISRHIYAIGSRGNRRQRSIIETDSRKAEQKEAYYIIHRMLRKAEYRKPGPGSHEKNDDHCSQTDHCRRQIFWPVLDLQAKNEENRQRYGHLEQLQYGAGRRSIHYPRHETT